MASPSGGGKVFDGGISPSAEALQMLTCLLEKEVPPPHTHTPKSDFPIPASFLSPTLFCSRLFLWRFLACVFTSQPQETASPQVIHSLFFSFFFQSCSIFFGLGLFWVTAHSTQELLSYSRLYAQKNDSWQVGGPYHLGCWGLNPG